MDSEQLGTDPQLAAAAATVVPAKGSLKKQVAKNTLSAWGYKIIKAGLTFFINPLLILEFGREGYGLIILFTTLISFADLADFGVRPSLGRFVSEARAKSDTKAFNSYINSALLVYGGLWVVLSGLLLLGSGWFVRQFATEVQLQTEAALLFRYYGVFTLFIAFFRPVFSAIISGFGRFDVRNGIETVYTLLSGVGVLVVLYLFDLGLAGWVGINMVALMLNAAMLYRSAKKLAPYMAFGREYVSKAALKDLYGLGGLVFLSQWARRIKYDADPFIITRFMGPGAISTYKPGNSLMTNIKPLLDSFAGQLYPTTTDMHTRGDMSNLRKLFFTSSRYTIMLSIPMLVLFLAFGLDVMRIWMGGVLLPAEVRTAGFVLMGWAVIEFASSLEGAATPILFGMKKVRLLTFSYLVVAGLGLLTSIILIKTTSLGVLALLIGPAVLEFIIRPWYLWYAGRNVGAGFLEIVKEIYLPAGLLTLLAGGLAVAVRSAVVPSGLFLLLLDFALVGLGYLALAYAIGLRQPERAFIKDFVAKKLRQK